MNTPPGTTPRGSSSSSTMSFVLVASSSKSNLWSTRTLYRFARLDVLLFFGRSVEASCHFFGLALERL